MVIVEAFWTSWKLSAVVSNCSCFSVDLGYLLKAGEDFEGVHDAPGEHDHDAYRRKGNIFPQAIWDEGRFADALAVVHPHRKCGEEDYTQREQ